MSRMIMMSPDNINAIIKEFEEMLRKTKLSSGKINYQKSFEDTKCKAKVYLSQKAWIKTYALLKNFDKEVAWHGVARRGDNPDEHTYYIDDIVVYPQKVTGTTVDMDTEAYAKWIMDNIEDDRFNNIYMQAHSHVTMGTSPSATDITHQEEILEMLSPDGFYIFMIWNKSLSINTKIYDMKKNLMFENTDVTVDIYCDDVNVGDFVKSAKDFVVEKTYYSPTTTPSSYTSNTKKEDKPAKDKNKKKKRSKVGGSWKGGSTWQYRY